MTIKSDKIQLICFAVSVFLFFSIISGAISSNIDNNVQSAFSQGNNSSAGLSKYKICPDIAYPGPSYTDSNGCTRPCQTINNNVLPGCPHQSSLTINNLSHNKIKSNR